MEKPWAEHPAQRGFGGAEGAGVGPRWAGRPQKKKKKRAGKPPAAGFTLPHPRI